MLENAATATAFTAETQRNLTFSKSGEVVSAFVTIVSGQTVSKGGVYVALTLLKAGTQFNTPLTQGWCYNNHFLSLGVFEDFNGLPWAVADARVQYNNDGLGITKVDIVPGNAVSSFTVNGLTATNSGTNGIQIRHYDTTTALDFISLLANVASAAATRVSIPSIGTAASTSANVNQGEGGLVASPIIAGTESLSIEQTVAGAANDKIDIVISISFKGQLPTFATGRSTVGVITVAAGSTTWSIKG